MRIVEIARIPQSDVNAQTISAGIRTALGTKRTVVGQIDGVTVSLGQSSGGILDVIFAEDRKALGYALLNKADVDGVEGCFVTEIGLKPALRGRGVGIGFYHLLLDQGYTLFSGATQTPDGEAIWRKLMNDPKVTTTIRNVDGPVEDGADPWADPGHVIVARRA